MNKRIVFLLGLIVGQAAMLPYVFFWKNHPVVEAVPFPEGMFKQFVFRRYVMKDVPHLDGGKRDLTVIITNEDNVRALYQKLSGEYAPDLMGFYNPERHMIITVDSVDILVHEMRHVFEGAFHRGPQHADICH